MSSCRGKAIFVYNASLHPNMQCINGSRWLSSCLGRKSNNQFKLQHVRGTGPCDDLPYHLQQAYWSSWGLSLFILWKSELRASNSTARGAITVVFEGKSTPPLSYLWIYAVHRFSLIATMDLCWLRKQQKENPDRERESVPMSNFLVIWSDIQRLGGEYGPSWTSSIIIPRPFALGDWVWINIL